jgi:cytochrome c551/c552
MKKLVLFCSAFFALSFSAQAQDAAVTELLEKHACYTCHSVKKKMVGPTWGEIAKKGYDKKRFTQLVHKPEPANWPTYTPMAALPKVPKADIAKIHAWVSTLK